MVSKVEMFQSDDGKLHTSSRRALEHEANLCRARIGKYIDDEGERFLEKERRAPTTSGLASPAPRTIGHHFSHEGLAKLSDHIGRFIIAEMAGWGDRASCPRNFLSLPVVVARLEEALESADTASGTHDLRTCISGWIRELKTGKKPDELTEEEAT